MRRIPAICLLVVFPKPFALGAFHAWCSLRYFGCGETPNSMCIYDEAFFKNQCLNMVDGIVKEPWIRMYWLALVNSFRDKVAGGHFDPWPKAANMKQVVWDDILQAQARRWNFQCYLEHPDECNRNSDYNKTEIGQVQSYMRDVTKSKFATHVKEVFESVVRLEHRILNVEELVDKGISSEVEDRSHGPDYLLASLLFADSEKVGASLIVSGWENNNASNMLRTNTYLAPVSLQSAVYKQGSPCSQCPENWSCRITGSYVNLCAQSSYPSYAEYIEVNCALRRFKHSFTMPIFVSLMINLSAKLF